MRRILACIVTLAAVLLVGAHNTNAQQEQGSEPLKAPADVNDNNRLPPGYSEIITNSQKRSIYKIQQSYQSQIESLRKQIEAIESKRDQEVAAVLDDEQRTILRFILKIRERNRAELEKRVAAPVPDPAVDQQPAAAEAASDAAAQ